MFDSRMESTRSGRRFFDGFLSKTGQIIVVISFLAGAVGFVGNTFLKSQQIETNKTNVTLLSQRVTILEQIKVDDHYMICALFSKAHPDAVPASCELAIK